MCINAQVNTHHDWSTQDTYAECVSRLAAVALTCVHTGVSAVGCLRLQFPMKQSKRARERGGRERGKKKGKREQSNLAHSAETLKLQ